MPKAKRKPRPPADKTQVETKMCTKCGIRPRRTQQSRGATWCAQCASEYGKFKRAADFAAGFCMRCPNRRRPDSTFCQECADKKSKYRKGKRDIVKQQIVDYLGGACVECGLETIYLDAYDCHHLDASGKDLNIGWELSKQRTFEQLKPELDKCVLICATCHRIYHQQQRENKETTTHGNRSFKAPPWQTPRVTANYIN